jgi:epoxyqueuosine reductase QueG
MKDIIRSFITERMSDPEYNTQKELPLFAFGAPICGFASASDPLFGFYKEHIDKDFYMLPTEWLERKYGRKFSPSEVSVVSWALPQTEDTKSKCRALSDCPAYEWQMTRVHGEECNRDLASALEEMLDGMGICAIAPMSSEVFSWRESEKFVKISNWSERHTAHICGLGTFGKCDGLITPIGKAVRFGSVIFAMAVEPDSRPYTRYNEYCLYDKGCRACANRCPIGAIGDSGHDKVLCMKYHAEVITKLCKERYDYEGYRVCGLCQTGVPCESGIPGRKEGKK